MWKHHLKYIGYKAIIILCLCLPQRFLYWIALRISDLNWAIDSRGRNAVKSNLRIILPQATEERIAYETRWVFRNFGKYLSEFFRFRHFDKHFFDKHVALRGREHMMNVLAQGKGMIALSAHLSNWELGAGGMRNSVDTPVHVVAEPHIYAKANDLFIRERKSMNINVIPVAEAGRSVIKALRNNEIVCILGDRDPSEAGVTIEFFGRPCRFPQGPARFAIATGAPIVPGYILRRTNDSFTIWFLEPILVPEEGTRDEKVQAMTQAYARLIEEAIRYHPEEWTVFYRVWEEEWKQ